MSRWDETTRQWEWVLGRCQTWGSNLRIIFHDLLSRPQQKGQEKDKSPSRGNPQGKCRQRCIKHRVRYGLLLHTFGF